MASSPAQHSIPDPLKVRGRRGRVHSSLIWPQVPPTGDDDVRYLVTSLKAAREGVVQMNNMPDSMGRVFATVNSCLRPIKIFISVVQTISNVRPLSFGAHVTKLRLDSPICETSFMRTIMGRSGTSQSYTRLHYI